MLILLVWEVGQAVIVRRRAPLLTLTSGMAVWASHFEESRETSEPGETFFIFKNLEFV